MLLLCSHIKVLKNGVDDFGVIGVHCFGSVLYKFGTWSPPSSLDEGRGLCEALVVPLWEGP